MTRAVFLCDDYIPAFRLGWFSPSAYLVGRHGHNPNEYNVLVHLGSKLRVGVYRLVKPVDVVAVTHCGRQKQMGNHNAKTSVAEPKDARVS